jgi:hypothetical protein
MQSFLDAKIMAKALRLALSERDLALSHGDCLELVARQFGLADWNTLAARIAAVQNEGGLALPEGWFVTDGTDLRSYRLGLDPVMPGAALIESRFKRGSGVDLSGDTYAVLMQSVDGDAYRGQRLKLTAPLKTEDADAGTIWMRVDQSPGSVVRFDNMLTRKRYGAIKGTNDWTARSIVLDVPESAASIHYGFLLQGYGRVWARGFEIEPVGEDTATTAGSRTYPPAPRNLDFARAL